MITQSDNASKKKVPYKKVMAPIFSYMSESKQERHVNDSFLNPILAEHTYRFFLLPPLVGVRHTFQKVILLKIC